MAVHVVPFARIREIVGGGPLERDAAGSTALVLWEDLAAEYPDLAPLRGSTRFARNGEFVGDDAVLGDGDELCLLPPFGGG